MQLNRSYIMAEANHNAAQIDHKTYLADLREHINAATFGASACNDLSVLFLTIRNLAGEHSQISRLAGIGLYLAEDFGNHMDCRRGEAEAAFNAAKGGAA
jgi:hypothetical protein